MKGTDKIGRGISRREFLEFAGFTPLAMGVGALAGGSTPVTAISSAAEPAGSAGDRRYNILFILTDQERYFDPSELPPGYSLPGRDRLQRKGVTFSNHQINSAVCTSSRSVIYTGRHIQHTKLFDNLDFPWSKSLDPNIDTLGSLLGDAGYYPAYKGKWHLSKELRTHDELALPQEKLTQVMESYGFRDYVGIGDVIGMTRGGYLNDDVIAAQAQRWLRILGQPMNQRGEPWFLAVNLVNPHDVMFYNTDAPGQKPVQNDPKTLMAIAREPDVPFYHRQWDIRLPATRREPFDKKGRPPAHREYQLARGVLVGNFPNEDARWRPLLNYYLNCIRDTDRQLEVILDELKALGLRENTIVVMTSDHGELGGAHGTHGKGATAYKEQNQVPLVIAHPGYPGTHGQRCHALTSHLDLAPTMLAWTGSDAGQRAGITRDLRGKNLTPLLEKGETAGVNEVRDGSLYSFNMFGYLDGDFMMKIQNHLKAGGDKRGLKAKGYKPDFEKRGAIRSVFDGRYKYSRYFSPRHHNQPQTLEGIFELNDVELFDLETDPDETRNLALDPKKNADLLLAMNAKMNELIETEVGEPDDGGFLPGKNADWAATTFDP